MNAAHERALIPDCGGLVEELALTLPAAFLSDGRGWDARFKPLVPIGNLLSSLPKDVGVHIFVDQAAVEKAEAWLSRLTLGCSVSLVPIDSGLDALTSPWIQDLVHVRTKGAQDDKRFEIVAEPKNVLAAAMAEHLRMHLVSDGLVLPGGNQLVGQAFRLIGYSELVRPGLAHHNTYPDTNRWQRIAAIDLRSVCLFGYRTDDLARASATGELSGRFENGWSLRLRDSLAGKYAFSGGHVHQCGFHVDQFVSVTGLFVDDRPLLLVADPVVPNDPDSRFSQTFQKQLNASVLFLDQQGFAVVRNPIPLAVTPDSGKRLPRLYNNVLLENTCRSGRLRPLVWVPQFGDIEPLEEFDRQNLAIWERLGFDPVPVPGWSYLASRNGAIRCMIKVLRRSHL